MRTSAARPGDKLMREVLRVGVVGVEEGEEGQLTFGEMAFANAVAAPTKAVVSDSCFCRLGSGAPTIIGTRGGSSISS